MQNHPKLLLLRRPLPPKLPKLPLRKKEVQTAKTGKILHVKFAQDESTLIQRDKTSFPDVVSRNQSQTIVTIQNISLDQHVQERVTTISTSPKSFKTVCWKIPETATGCIFFPSCLSASSRIFGKETNQMKRLRKSKEASKIKNISVENMLKDILVLSSRFSKSSSVPSPVITPKLKEVLHSEYLLLPKSRTYTFKHTLIDLNAKRPRPLPRTTPVQEKPQQFHHLQQNINHFPDIFMPAPILPRKPQRQSVIETRVIENENLESVPKRSIPILQEGLIKPRKRDESEANVIRGDGFKTVAATRYETVIAMTNLAIVNCQVYGRNALNLMGFFILNCPDLTPLAFQLIYLNLSFNDIRSFPTEVFCLKYLQILILRNNPIKEISSEIQQLKLLRVFNIAFNLITTLPSGLFSLTNLEELDISYNSIAFIPNEIQKLRSLKKLIVDGNEMTSFPSGILKLNLKKLLFANTFTHPSFWKENSLNSPQRLTQLTSLIFLKNNLHKYYDVIPGEIQTLLNCTTTCEWCNGPKFGEGYRIIQSCNVFGTTQLPVMFHVCSSLCYRKVKENSCVLDSIAG
ncbi:leucine rich repeat containing 63 [Rhinolophus ferrumequinum]|uniref:Leucine rich repeat containing 63 n=1 Tax=Rhinolophus ferrumequinum TaxID=59479 RepID=A0A7J7ZQ76_RHIFE|nr:leucine-rich repeat-containing protein 63 [Rhinolophus ferrumequinum]KAF6376457.1 leucine rich repeat containing 63 [Rhinolophus ferrumequinum]